MGLPVSTTWVITLCELIEPSSYYIFLPFCLPFRTQSYGRLLSGYQLRSSFREGLIHGRIQFPQCFSSSFTPLLVVPHVYAHPKNKRANIIMVYRLHSLLWYVQFVCDEDFFTEEILIDPQKHLCLKQRRPIKRVHQSSDFRLVKWPFPEWSSFSLVFPSSLQ